MAKIEYKLNRRAAVAVMKSEKARQMVTDAAKKVAGRAGDGFEAETAVGWDRHRGKVSAKTAAARRRQARDHVIERAAGGGL